MGSKPTYRSLEGLLKLKAMSFGFGVWTVLKTLNRLLKDGAYKFKGIFASVYEYAGNVDLNKHY